MARDARSPVMLHGWSLSFFTSSLKYLFKMFFRARFFEALRRFSRERHNSTSTCMKLDTCVL
jgi:hypothetical protein